MVKNSINDLPRRKKFDGDTFTAFGVCNSKAEAERVKENIQRDNEFRKTKGVNTKTRVRVSEFTIHVLCHGPVKKYVVYVRTG